MKVAALALMLVGAILTSGCAYTISSKLDAQDTRTIHFDGADNRLYPPRAGLEYDLTERIKDEIAVDRRLVLTDGHGDVRLKVVLSQLREPILVEDLDTGDPAEVMLSATVTVEGVGKEFHKGRVKRTISVSSSYAPSLGETQADGFKRLWRDMAREIVDFAADREWAE